MAAMKPAIQVDNLSFDYRGKQVLNNISVGIPENKFTVFLGRNGSGKSTLMRLMLGLLPYNMGNIKIYGKELKDLAPKKRAKKLGFLPQQHKAVFPFKVQEVVLTGRAAHVNYTPGKADLLQVKKAMEMAGVQQLSHRIYSELSGGEQQLVMIARVLAQQPNILLLDEPVSHLDYNNQVRLLRLLKNLVSDGMTIAAVIHDPNLAFALGEHFIFVHDGAAVESGSKNACKHELVDKIFHSHIQRLDHRGRHVFIPCI